MVIFHLPLVEETYPVLREAVYTFHMVAFLVISGCLASAWMLDKMRVSLFIFVKEQFYRPYHS